MASSFARACRRLPLVRTVVIVAVGLLSWASLASAQPAVLTWPTYGGNSQRAGAATQLSLSSSVSLQWQSPQLDGDVYAEPLSANNRAFVATENDTVYALDDASGAVVWSTHLAEPVSASTLPCGNIDPVGITSTPVIDPAAGVLYTVAFQQPAHHELYALDLGSGAVRYHQPIDPPGADPLTHLQRAALTASPGVVYVSFGGRFGDCGQYHGWVVAANAADGSTSAVYQVPTQREGAIWATAGPTVDGDGNLLVATGNGGSRDAFDFGNAVIKLSPDLKLLDWFAPSDWATMSARDQDLGSTSPVLLNNGQVFQIGKTGTGYLVQEAAMGNIGGQTFSAPVCGGAYGGVAYADPYLYVGCRDGLTAVQFQEGGFSVAWRALPGFANPAIVVGSTVWTISRGDGQLYAVSALDGSVQFQSGPPPAAPPHFATPGLGQGHILTVWGRGIAAFGS